MREQDKMTVLYSSQLNIVTVQARPGKRPRCQGPETPGEDEELAALGLGLRLYKGVSGRAGESGQGRSGRGVHGVYSGNLKNHLEIRRLQELKGVPDNSPGGELCLS